MKQPTPQPTPHTSIPGKLYAYHFDSCNALCDALDAYDPSQGLDNRSRHYTGLSSTKPAHEMYRDGLHKMRTGDTAAATAAAAYVDKIMLNIETPHTLIETSPVGFMPCVANFLAGQPDSMFTQQEYNGPFSPLRIFVSTSCSWTVTEDQLNKRGAVLAALALALSNVRPVTIIPVWVAHGKGRPTILVSYNLQNPLALSELTCLTDPAITRYAWIRGMYHTFDPHHTQDGVPFATFDETLARQHLGMTDDDIWIGHATYGDPLLAAIESDPLPWLQQYIDKYSSNE